MTYAMPAFVQHIPATSSLLICAIFIFTTCTGTRRHILQHLAFRAYCTRICAPPRLLLLPAAALPPNERHLLMAGRRALSPRRVSCCHTGASVHYFSVTQQQYKPPHWRVRTAAARCCCLRTILQLTLAPATCLLARRAPGQYAAY